MSLHGDDWRHQEEHIAALEAELTGLKQDLAALHNVRDKNSRLREENIRFGKEWQQTHDWNNKLVSEHYKLREENVSLRQSLELTGKPLLAKRLTELSDENTRLRAELERAKNAADAR